MWLSMEGVYRANDALLDTGVSDTALVHMAQGTYLVTTTGKYGGLTVYRVTEDGSLIQTDQLILPDNLQMRITDKVAAADVNGHVTLLFGASSTITGVRLRDDGTLGPIRHIPFEDFLTSHEAGAEGALSALTRLTDQAIEGLPQDPWQTQTVAVFETVVAGRSYLLTLGGLDDQVTAYRKNFSGNWRKVDALGPEQGLGIPAPTAMELVALHGQTYLVVASSASSSISVVAVQPGGNLRPVQQLMDTGSTRFQNVQDLAMVQVGDQVYVFAVGADHGVTMFQLLPDGQLFHLESWGDDGSGAVHTPVTISAALIGTKIHVTVGSQNTEGIAHLTVDVAALGSVLVGSPDTAESLRGGNGHDTLIAGSDNDTLIGGAGNDVLVSGPGRTSLTGGSGANLFVIRPESTVVRITDFERGVDQLDLSALPMLRSHGQLDFRTTSSGAVIGYRSTTIEVHSHDGASLRIEDIFPKGLVGPDSLILSYEDPPTDQSPPLSPGYPEGPPPTPPSPPPPPLTQNEVSGQWLIGTNGRDTLTGGNGDDYIYGGNGNDLIRGGRGNDSLYGGFGHDTIFGGPGDDLIVGGPGNDRMWGEDGNDTIFAVSGNNRFGGGPGNDLLIGGTGHDTIYGGLGDDTIFGNAGHNGLWGMDGDDVIHGGSGNDRIGGGRGNDTIYGHAGNNTIYGGMGEDLI